MTRTNEKRKKETKNPPPNIQRTNNLPRNSHRINHRPRRIRRHRGIHDPAGHRSHRRRRPVHIVTVEPARHSQEPEAARRIHSCAVSQHTYTSMGSTEATYMRR